MKIHLFYTMHRHGMHFVFKMEIKKKKCCCTNYENKHRVFSIFSWTQVEIPGYPGLYIKSLFCNRLFLLITFLRKEKPVVINFINSIKIYFFTGDANSLL